MAYKKGYKGKKKTSGWQDIQTVGKLAYKHRGAAKGIAKKALKLALKLKDAVNIEYKDYEDVLGFNKLGDGTNNPAVQNSITAYPLCIPQQGTAKGQRIGDSIKLQRFTLRGRVSWVNQAAPSGGTVTASVRLILFRGKADNGQLYNTTSGTLPMLDQLGVLGAKSDENKYNTKFLYDKTYKLDISSKNLININWNFPLNWHQNFQVGTTDIQDGGFYLIALADTGTSAKCEFIGNYCVSYTDD